MSTFQKKLLESGLPQSSDMNRKQIEAIADSFSKALLGTYDEYLSVLKKDGVKDAEKEAYIKTTAELYGYSSDLATKSSPPISKKK